MADPRESPLVPLPRRLQTPPGKRGGHPRGTHGQSGRRIVRTLASVIAVLFGAATLLAGGRVLLGSDPGYDVFRPLVLYNTGMGVAYLAAGIAIWRGANSGRTAAGAIFVLNLVVLAGIVVVYLRGGAVAVESLRAMGLRTVVWLAVFLAASWAPRAARSAR